MGISEAKKQIVIDNYFKTSCNVNTFIKEAFTKGFEVGLTKAVFPKVDYETRLKADKMGLLKEIQDDASNIRSTIWDCDSFMDGIKAYDKLIQQKIDKLQEEK